MLALNFKNMLTNEMRLKLNNKRGKLFSIFVAQRINIRRIIAQRCSIRRTFSSFGFLSLQLTHLQDILTQLLEF